MANTETVALMLNGKLIGEQKVDPYEMNEWRVPYAPGRLEAVGKTGGKVVAHAVVETTGAPVRAAADAGPRRGLAGDGRDAAPVTVEALDAQGPARADREPAGQPSRSPAGGSSAWATATPTATSRRRATRAQPLQRPGPGDRADASAGGAGAPGAAGPVRRA